MTQKNLFAAWLILTIVAVFLIFAIRYFRKAKLELELNELLDVALAVFGALSGCYLIYQTWSSYEDLQKIVSNEGLVAMALGGVASIWFGVSKVGESASKR